MTVAQLQRVQQASQGRMEPGQGLPTPGAEPGSRFRDTLNEAVNRVDGAQKHADAQVEAFVAGEQENVHDVMIAMNQAKLHFQLMNEVRSRALETYQELMRMQI